MSSVNSFSQTSRYQERRDAAVRAAAGRWRDIFISIGIEPRLVDGRARPCPICGGRDRFVFDDKMGRGNYFCRGCGPGDGFALISKYLQCSYPEALAAVEKFCGIVVHSPSSVQESAEQIEPQADLNPDPISKARAAMLALWSEAHPVEQGDPVWNYLLSRGLDPRSAHPEIRTHEGLEYVKQVEDDAAGEHGDDGEEGAEQGKGLRVRTLPVMLSRLTDADGVVINLHRTYLEPEGVKARVARPKKLLRGLPAQGLVRLGGIGQGGAIGIAEGVETALAASILSGRPVWASLGCGNMASIDRLPEGVRDVIVFSDNDEKFAGQAAAYAFAHRWACRGLKVEVRVPPAAGRDWLDELNALSVR